MLKLLTPFYARLVYWFRKLPYTSRVFLRLYVSSSNESKLWLASIQIWSKVQELITALIVVIQNTILMFTPQANLNQNQKRKPPTMTLDEFRKLTAGMSGETLLLMCDVEVSDYNFPVQIVENLTKAAIVLDPQSSASLEYGTFAANDTNLPPDAIDCIVLEPNFD